MSRIYEHSGYRAGLDDKGLPIWKCVCGWSGNWWTYVEHVGQAVRTHSATS